MQALDSIFNPQQIAGLHLIARDVNTTAIDGDVTVHHHLPRCRTGGRKANPVNDVVETTLQERHEDFTCIAGAALSTRKVGAKLPFKHSVIMLDLLFFAQMKTVLGRLATTLLHHARWRWSPLKRALWRVAAIALQK